MLEVVPDAHGRESMWDWSGGAEEGLMVDIRKFGSVPRRTKGVTKEEEHLAQRLYYARRNNSLSAEEARELEAMQSRDGLMEEIRKLGRVPRNSTRATKEETLLAKSAICTRKGTIDIRTSTGARRDATH